MTPQNNLRRIAFQTLLDLSTPTGINASGKEDVYGCIFGRDSAITILKILNSHSRVPNLELLDACRRSLITLASLQGKEFNIESGEEPGKFIHEFRPDNYDRLLKLEKPWYIYPDGVIRNYDSIDSTPLVLIAIYKYWQLTQDNEFLNAVLPSVESGLNWLISYGDVDKDLFLEYLFPQERKSGGLRVQSWTDSPESMQGIDGALPPYPIAPVEVQSFAWLAMRLWSDFYLNHHPEFGRKLLSQSRELKRRFNDFFIIEDQGLFFACQALDGVKRQVGTVTANPLICLWSVYNRGDKKESILEERYIEHFVKRAFMDDMFDEDAGVRTMSTLSPTYNPGQNSYHNGSFWPMLNGLIHEGLENYGFRREAKRLKRASLKALQFFGTPIELYVKGDNGSYLGYLSSGGQGGCQNQAWSAASLLDFLT